jgi:hypothetical protein
MLLASEDQGMACPEVLLKELSRAEKSTGGLKRQEYGNRMLN